MSGDGAQHSFKTVVERLGLDDLVSYFGDTDEHCTCKHEVDDDELVVDASDCDGNLATAEHCRKAVITTLADTEVETILIQSRGNRFLYGTEAVALLSAAGRFVELLGDRHERLGEAALYDPLAVTNELDNRVDPIADVGIESGLVQVGARVESYDRALSPARGLSIAYYYVDKSIPEGSRLADVKRLETGSEVRIYEREDKVPLYEIDVVDLSLTPAQRELLIEGYEAIAEGEVEGERAASRALESAADDPVDPLLTSILAKHTDGYGILEDLFSDPEVTDIFVTSPVDYNPIRVEMDGETMATNIHLSEDGAAALASRVRRTSGRAFSRATPTVDATGDLESGSDIRIAGVTDPVADGIAFAFREQAEDKFTLPRLVENGTMTPEVAGFLSVAAERNAAALIAGTRGAGKTTLLGTLLYELTPDTRTVLIEDTPELPVDSLQSVDRDVQALRIGTGEGPEVSAKEALKTALRMGDGALVVGEIRGEEAQVLYEAMRIGANANAVLGTIHGDGADDVYERVVSDLNVEPSSFAATDLVVTCQAYQSVQGKKRRVSRIEEVMNDGEEVWFEPLFAIEDERAHSTGRIERGESRIVEQLAGPGEEYATVLSDIKNRTEALEQLAEDGRTTPNEITSAYARRGIK